MKLVVAGGRDFTDMFYMGQCLFNLQQSGVIPEEPELVCGMARGADMTAHKIWTKGDAIIHEFPADWSTGRGAGFVRNSQMAHFADAAVCFWDQQSRGTSHMISQMAMLNKPCWVFNY